MFKQIVIAIFILMMCNKISAQNANTTLSNLTAPTKINTNLLPSKDSVDNLGSAAKNWKHIYIKGKLYIQDAPTIFSINNSDFFAGPNAGIKLKFLNGQENTGIGTNALYYGGYDNSAVGWNSMMSDSIGHDNSALGGLSLANNIYGSYNVAVGWASSYWNNSGNYNTSIGYNASEINVSGNYNTSVGTSALEKNTSSNNTAVGDEAGVNNSRGNNNTYVGFHAGNTVTTGSSNTIIGYGADVGSNDLANATAIGNLAISGASNRVRIGNGSVTSIGGAVGWTNFSDERIKTNIQQNVPGLVFINLLNPVTYNFDLMKEDKIFNRKDAVEWKGKYDIQKIKFTGFIAQQVAAAAKKINYDFSGVDAPANNNDVYGLRYADFVVPLVKAVQELSQQNDSLKNENTQQQKINAGLEQRIEKLEALMHVSNQSSNNSMNSSPASLSQNIPNPSNNNTTINYSLPATLSSAQISIINKNGVVINQFSLSENKGSVTINTSSLKNGTYQYTLYANGKLIDTKQMEVMR